MSKKDLYYHQNLCYMDNYYNQFFDQLIQLHKSKCVLGHKIWFLALASIKMAY